MRATWTAWIVAGTIVSVGTGDAFAQSRHKVIHFKPATVTRTQWSPDASGSVPSFADAPDASPTIPSRSDSSTPKQDNAVSGGIDFNQMNTPTNRPSLQQIQNPSGAYQLTFINMSLGAYTTPNTYMGSQFNSWNNIQMQPIGLNEFEAFNRTQPPNSGWYVSPNTYVGAGFNQWSNLSSGVITPNYLGSWNYQN